MADLEPHALQNYSSLCQRLEQRFGPGKEAETFLTELRARTRKSGENLQELGQAVRRLTSLAYPELKRDVHERLAQGHFSDAISDPEIRAGIFRAHPKNLDEAIRAAIETEAYLKAERQRQGIRKPAAKFTRKIQEVTSNENTYEGRTLPTPEWAKELGKLMRELVAERREPLQAGGPGRG